MEEETRKKKDRDTKLDKKLRKLAPFLLGLVLLAVIFIALLYLFHGFGKINYEGLSFTKERFGEVIVYHYSYLMPVNATKIKAIDVYLRGNPRENTVPVEGKIVYPAGKVVYIGINSSGLNECEDSMIALSELTQFILANNIEIKVGNADKAEANRTNSSYIPCSHYPKNMVIILKSGGETRISRDDLCYTIEVANCEILPALEKFILQSIVDAKATTIVKRV